MNQSAGPAQRGKDLRTAHDGKLSESADVLTRYHHQSVERWTADHDDVLVDVVCNVGVRIGGAFVGDPQR